ncbi:Oidioi.mRNA.OKI2018_I69.chr1.g1202.t1.cds [Oikopleura dioica]|uniref:Oidioi.mRNA.OKI2018_I69.chr1.g1202.t1.cds n=1 Tax=Oikopleura dioica TaxID=34765 RepID=A0ABN7SUA0_OIKDI|nr:Oidioi.mRNA.OKI2018_I69.chr1.g1202.t1.cds [Oikopleura dioica]
MFGNFGAIIFAFNALLPVFGMIVPDHDFNGWLADTIGRKSALFWNNVVFFSAIAVNLVFINFYVYAVCRFFICSSACALMMIATLYGTETAVHFKSAAFLIWSCYSYFGILFASLLFYFFLDWKEQMLIKLFLSLLFFFMTFYFPETPVYLENIKKDKSLKSDRPKKFDVAPNRNYICTMFIFSFCCITTAFVYFGLLWGAGSLSGSLHWNSAINGMMALVGSMIIFPVLKIATSKTILSYSYFLICFVMGLAWVFPSTKILSISSFIGIFAVVLTFYAYFDIAKTFPVSCRSTTSGFCTVSGRLFVLVVPYLSLLPKTFRIGLLCILPGICGFLYRFIPDVPDNVTLQNVSDANQVFKQSHLRMRRRQKSEDKGLLSVE